MTTAIPKDQLQSALLALLNRIKREIRTSKDAFRLRLSKQKFTVRPDFSVLYTPDPTITNFPIEEIEQELWEPSEQEQFIHDCINQTVEYTDAHRTVSLTGQENALNNFVRRVAYLSAIEGDGANLERCLDTLLNDLTGGEQVYHAKVFLMGIGLRETVIEISDSLVLRRPTREDLQEKLRGEMVHYAHALRPYQARFSCIAELRLRVKQPVDVQRFIDQMVTTLQLFRIGSVSAPVYEYWSESFMSFGHVRAGGPPRTERLSYEFSSLDAPNFRRLLDTLNPAIPSLYEFPAREPDFLSTALQWYGEALLAGVPTQGAIASAVASFEALFLGDNPTTEITFRLVNRVAALLGFFGWPALEIRKVLTEAYEVRSRYVHGVSPSGKKGRNKSTRSHEELTALFCKTVEYARVSCLIWLQMCRLHPRQESLSLIDKSFVDESARAELRRSSNRIAFARMPW